MIVTNPLGDWLQWGPQAGIAVALPDIVLTFNQGKKKRKKEKIKI